MTRRMFLLGCSAADSLRGNFGGLVLDAVAAPLLPATLRIPGVWPARSPLYELRQYYGAAGSADDLLAMFLKTGMDAALVRQRPHPIFLIGFSGSAERALAWTRLNTDPQWPAVRRSIGKRVGLSLWRPSQPGIIREISL